MQKKFIFPKMLLWFLLIPYLAVLLLTALECVTSYAYIDYFWVKEWMIAVPESLGYYLLLAMVYGLFGIAAYAVFFGKTWEKWVMPAIAVLAAFLLPFLRYLVYHICYGDELSNVEMLVVYNGVVLTSLTMLVYAVLALFVIAMERLYYAAILCKKPTADARFYSPKSPVGLSMMIFFGAVAIWSTINFMFGGDFSGKAWLSILIEYVIDGSGFFVSTFAAATLHKWNQTEKSA